MEYECKLDFKEAWLELTYEVSPNAMGEGGGLGDTGVCIILATD